MVVFLAIQLPLALPSDCLLMSVIESTHISPNWVIHSLIVQVKPSNPLLVLYWSNIVIGLTQIYLPNQPHYTDE